MAWDLALDRDSGDLMFGPASDLLGCTGEILTNQRILVRSRIPRGSFIYDKDNTLGSRLFSISGASKKRQLAELPPLLREALEPMDDISIQSIDAQPLADGRVEATVRYQMNSPSQNESEAIVPDTTPVYTATVTY